MASYICGLPVFSAFLSVLVASLSEYYEANLEFDNKVPTLEPMNSKYADSSVRCAMLCGSGCKCFTFNEHTRLCLSYSLCNAIDKTVNKIGWRLYVKQSLPSNGEYEVFAYKISYSNINDCFMAMSDVTLKRHVVSTRVCIFSCLKYHLWPLCSQTLLNFFLLSVK